MKLRFNQPRPIVLRVAAVAVVLAIAATHGLAQPDRQGPSLFKTNPKQREQPVRITSVTLEVQDKKKLATFTGDVQVVQGETDLRCNVLVVYYDGDSSDAKSGNSAKSGKAGPSLPGGSGGNQRIRRMEAKGSVVMTQVDQRAIGDHADFDVLKNTMVLTGNVVVMRGDDVVRGRRLHVDMTTGIYRMENDPGGRVEMLIKSKAPQQPQTAPKPKRSN